MQALLHFSPPTVLHPQQSLERRRESEIERKLATRNNENAERKDWNMKRQLIGIGAVVLVMALLFNAAQACDKAEG